jgi:hypothetical protein
MSAKNIYHDSVVDALKADGWTITDDPLTFAVGERNVHIDLGAERSPGTNRVGVVLIAVEVQSFIGRSPVADLQQAVGQYVMYESVLDSLQPDRKLFLAIPAEAYDGIMSEQLGALTLTRVTPRLLVFDPVGRRIVRWIS